MCSSDLPVCFPVTIDGAVKINTTYTLAKVEDGIAEITIKGGIPRKAKTQSKNGMTHSVSIEGVQTGTIKIDANSGWILGSKIQMNTTEKESLSDGKQSQLKNFMEGFKLSFNEKFLKEQFGKNLNILPAKGVKLGGTWTQSDNVTPDGSVKINTTYTRSKIS